MTQLPGTMSDPMRALLDALEEARVDGSLEALALGDEQGLLVAGAGAVWLCEEMAALAPFAAVPEAPANDVIPNRLDLLTRSRVLRVKLDGVELLLSGRGGNPEAGLAAAARSALHLLDTRARPAALSGTANEGLDLSCLS